MMRWRTLAQTAWRDRAREGLVAAGWPAVLLAALVATRATLWIASNDLQAQQEKVQEDYALALQRMRALQASSSSATAPAAGSAAAFQVAFPDSQLREQRTLGLLVLARRYGLQVKQTSMRTLAPTALALVAYEVAMPMVGPYIDLRGFLDEALRSDPGLTLRSFKLQRKDVLTDLFQAQLVFTLYMQGGPTR
jgi:hypothetical protein